MINRLEGGGTYECSPFNIKGGGIYECFPCNELWWMIYECSPCNVWGGGYMNVLHAIYGVGDI